MGLLSMNNKLKMLNDLLRAFQLGNRDDSYARFLEQYRILLTERLETKFNHWLKYIIDNLLYDNEITLFFINAIVSIGNLLSIESLINKKKQDSEDNITDEALNAFSEYMTRGNKKHLVLLFKEDSNGLQKIDPRKGGEEHLGLLSFMPVVASILVFLFTISISKNIIISWFSSIASSIVVIFISMLIFINRIRKYDITNGRVIKIDIEIDPNTLKDKYEENVGQAISLLSSSNYSTIQDALDYINTKIKPLLNNPVINIEEYQLRLPQDIKKLRKTRIYIAISSYCNAFSMGLPKKSIFISNKMFACMNRHELNAVLYHELSHIMNNDSTWLMIILSATNAFGIIFAVIIPIYLGLRPIYVSLSYLVYLIGSIIIIKQYNKWRELKADRGVINLGKEEATSEINPVIIKGLLASLIKVGYPDIFKKKKTYIRIKAFMLDDHPSIEKRISKILNLTFNNDNGRTTSRLIGRKTMASPLTLINRSPRQGLTSS